MGLGVAKADEHPFAKELFDIPPKTGDHLGASLHIGPEHIAEVFGIQSPRERRRLHQVAKHYRELAPLWGWSVAPGSSRGTRRARHRRQSTLRRWLDRARR